MQSKRILVISLMLVMSITSLTNTQVFAQNTTQSSNTNPSQNASSGLNSSGNFGVNSQVNLDESATEMPILNPTPTPTELPTLGIGKYDDRDPNLGYTGNWSQHGISNLFSGTESYSTSIGSSVSIKLQGGSVSLFYREHTFFGTVKVTIDGTEAATIDQHLPYEIRNVSWTSDELDSNVPHLVTFTHTSGTYMSMDAISVNDPKPVEPTIEVPTVVLPVPTDIVPDEVPTNVPTDVSPTNIPTTVPPTQVPTTVPPTATATNLPPTVVPLTSMGPGNYDDRYASIIYKGSWIKQILLKNYLRTETYSNAVGSTATLSFVGESFTLVYRAHPVLGKLGVNIDGVDVGVISQTSSSQIYQKKWVSGDLGYGTHTIILSHLSGTYVAFDGIFISGSPSGETIETSTSTPPSPAGYGTYDDYSNKIVFSGTWIGQPLQGNYLSTEHYSSKIGSTASFSFTGESVTLVYRGYPTILGTMNITIDGQLVAAINQNTSSQTLQNKWSSGSLSSGAHTITLSHVTGTYVTMDALIVSGTPNSTPTTINTVVPTSTPAPTNTKTPLPPVGYGTYDDLSGSIVYDGNWIKQSIANNYAGTEHYSNLIGSSANFTFNGEFVTVVYRGYPSILGTMNVYMDGVLVGAINQNTSSQTFLNKWSSQKLTSGKHTLKLTHLSGQYITLDEIIVSSPPTATPTKTNTAIPTSTFTPSTTPVPSLTPTPGTAGMYYVDSVAGLDTNSGTSISSPWKSLSAITSRKFNAGSIISFKRGSSFSGSFIIDDLGTASSPIVFTAYGTGASPKFQNPGSNTNKTRAITVNADYIVVEGFLITNAQEAGVYISAGSDYVTVRNNEISITGDGIVMRGIGDKVINNYIHDLHMIHNDAGGDDDYGANGILLSGPTSNGEIAYNRIVNCKDTSYDYGIDGGTIEFWGAVSGYKIHHNFAEASEGFAELGSNSNAPVSNNIISYNVMYNNGRPFGAHIGNGFAITLSGMRLENNTIVDTVVHGNTQAINFWGGTPTTNMLTVRNNIFYLTTYSKVATHSTFTHDHNLYFFNGKSTSLGFTLGTGESIANPLFVNVGAGDYSLMSGSPAINMGASLGYTIDYVGESVPNGTAPDMGGYEYQQ